MFPCRSLCAESPAIPVIGPADLVLESVERRFRRLRHTVWHKLRVASSHAIIRGMSKGRQTRFVPCTWGVRQDEYRWRDKQGFDDFAAFRSVAATMGWALVHSPSSGWAELLPGTMMDLMDKRSDLHMADYWVLTLHHLVWSKRLPYPIKARWIQGASIHDQPFCFVSELPTDLTEASMDALILFREAILAPSNRAFLPPELAHAAAASIRPIEPPSCQNGAWSSAGRHDPAEPAAQTGTKDSVAPAAISDPESAPTSFPRESVSDVTRPQVEPSDSKQSALPQLNDQSFTVKFGGSTYRFTPRNKQLFALLDRISRRPGYRVLFDDLRAVGDVWDGLNVEDSTIRGAVARLRRLLSEHAMSDLAGRITTGTYQGRAYIVLQVADEDLDNA